MYNEFKTTVWIVVGRVEISRFSKQGTGKQKINLT